VNECTGSGPVAGKPEPPRRRPVSVLGLILLGVVALALVLWCSPWARGA
jgi:hypothetical protein